MSNTARWWTPRWVWWVGFFLVVVSGGATLLLVAMAGNASSVYLISTGIWAPFGLLLWRRLPDHPLGPLFTTVGLLSIFVVPGVLMGVFVVPFEATIEPSLWPMILALAFGGAYSYLFVMAILLFPEGSPKNAAQRWTVWLILLATAVAAVSGLLADPLGPLTNPLVDADTAERAAQINQSMTESFGFALLVVVGLKVFDYVKSEKLRRVQLKWLMYVLVLYLVFTVIGYGVIGVENSGFAGALADALISTLIPVTMASAVLRYRLYDIDRLISRTVTYAMVVLLLSLFFALPVLLFADLVGAQGDIVVAATTLTVASAFNPVRRRVQRIVERRFNRSRYDLEVEISGLATRLSSRADMAYIRDETTGLVGRTLQPSTIGFWIKES